MHLSIWYLSIVKKRKASKNIALSDKAGDATIETNNPEIVHYTSGTGTLKTGPNAAYESMEYPEEPIYEETH